MDKIVQIGLLGFGTVGTGVVRVLTDNSQLIAQRAGTAITINKILVRDLKKKRALSTAAELTTEPAAVIGDPEIDIVVELLGGEEPARTLMLEALNHGKHVVTANKDVMAKYGRERRDVEINAWPWIAVNADKQKAIDDSRATVAALVTRGTRRRSLNTS